MTTFNIATAVNIDTLTPKVGSDTYNILNDGYLTVDQDTRYGLNNQPSASMGNITMAAGGKCTVKFDATKCRLIPYTSGGGTVPTGSITITQANASGTASGLLISVYSASYLTNTPNASGSVMPPSGYVKIKQWNDIPFLSGSALTGSGTTGITGSVTDTDITGWIEIVGVDALTATVNRLNSFLVTGSWYDIGATSGVNTTVYQIPTNGSTTVWLPGVWVETAASSSAYEFYPLAANITAATASIATDSIRGKVCWISTSGSLTFQRDSLNSTGGYLPPSQRRIRIPNIFFSCCTAAAPAVNVLPNATLATRFDFTTTGGAVIDIRNCCMNWYLSLVQPYSVRLENAAFMTAIAVQEIASYSTWNQVGIGQETPVNTQTAFAMSLCFAGGTITDCVWERAALGATGLYVSALTDVSGFTFIRNTFKAHVFRGHATSGAGTWIRVSNCTFTDCTTSARLLLTTCASLTFTNTTYFDHIASNTIATYPHYIFDLATKCSDILIDGVTFGGLPLTQPYSGILDIAAAGCTNIKLRNLGTYASPLDMGGTQVEGAAWTRAGTVATVTKVAHGLDVGNIIYVLVSDNVSCITVGSKTITTVPTLDTFTFTCLAAGTSGVLTYYPTISAYLFVQAASAAASNIEVKRCYTPHLRTGLYSSDNSSKGILVENVRGDYINAPIATAIPVLNLQYKGVHATPALTAQVSTYGAIWSDSYVTETVANTGSQNWNRITTTAYVTSSDHNMRTGMAIVVNSASNEAAILKGQKSVTARNKDVFYFTCVDTGATTGTLNFEPITGRIALMMNETTAETITDCTLSGTLGFTSAGTLFYPTADDMATFETPEYIIGHESFPIAELVMTGGAKKNFKTKYYIDLNDGNGYSAAKNLCFPVSYGSGSTSSTFITMSNTSGVAVGDYVFGTNVAPNAKITNIETATAVAVDIANIGVVTGSLTFNQLPSQTGINTQNGFKLKISAQAVKGTSVATWARTTTTATVTLENHGLTTNDVIYVSISSDIAAIVVGSKTVTVTNGNIFTFTCLSAGAAAGTITFLYPAITNMYIGTKSSETSRAYQYPLETVDTSLSVTNLQLGTEVRVYRHSDDYALAGIESSSDTFTYNYTWTGTDTSVYIRLMAYQYQWLTYVSQSLGSSGLTIPVVQQYDRQYFNPA